MSFRNTNSAENWDLIYDVFDKINFASFDFSTIEDSIYSYLKIYYPELFNDYIRSSELVLLIKPFALMAEQLSYRIDMMTHENFITTAQRKKSILKLAKLISYKPSRNIAARGLVKISSVTTTEHIYDSRGIDLSSLTIIWNDPNNLNWKEQFFLVMNHLLSTPFGQPQKSFEIGDVVMDMYSLKVNAGVLPTGTFKFSVDIGVDTVPMELVSTDINEYGPFEKKPELNTTFGILYSVDGIGDSSNYTGFLALAKQGVLFKTDYTLTEAIPNRRIEFSQININNLDVWVQKIDTDGNILEDWIEVDGANEQNIVFNDVTNRNKFEIETLENDQIAIIFGDGDFANMPKGTYRFWMRQSANKSIVIQQNKVINNKATYNYTSNVGHNEQNSFTFSLTTTLQNSAASETMEHIRQTAPSTYTSQNRMVNGQDCNTFLLKDQSILKLKTINRTFAGQPKYIDWNDASGTYENVKIFGDDAVLKYELGINSISTSASGQYLIDTVIEPLLSDVQILNTLIHISANNPATKGVISMPRRYFIEDNTSSTYYESAATPVTILTGFTADGSLKEKTAFQAVTDRHWYGEPIEYVQATNGQLWAKILDPSIYPTDDSKIYPAGIPRTIDGVNKYPPGDTGSGLQPIAEEDYFGLKFNRAMLGIGDGSINVLDRPGGSVEGEVWTIEFLGDGSSFTVRSNLRGSFPSGELINTNTTYQITPSGFQTPIDFFTITKGSTAFVQGDAFILDDTGSTPVKRTVSIAPQFNTNGVINLNGYWEILRVADMPHYASGITSGDELLFSQNSVIADIDQHSWIFFIKKVKQQPTNTVIGYEVYFRTLQLIVSSTNTKFWFNSNDVLLDYDTRKRVFDNIKVLRSNLDSSGNVLGISQTYDIVSSVKTYDGDIDINKLEIVPINIQQTDNSGNLQADSILQFEKFAFTSFEYFLLSTPDTLLDSSLITYSNDGNTIVYESQTIEFEEGSFVGTVDGVILYGRRSRMPSLSGGDSGLDFMWQHFSPYNNIIDPSPTNIHDSYIITQGYYDNVMSYIKGYTTIAPIAPTPLELRNSYGYLLTKKMLSDTFALHSGKLKLLFGALSQPQLRAKFKVIKTYNSTITNEKLKFEIVSIIDQYFKIDQWDFGESFYATDMITAIHNALPNDIASIVIVPIYSVNSFGDLFVVNAGFDEVLQSCASVSDIDVVDAFTSTVIRQIK